MSFEIKFLDAYFIPQRFFWWTFEISFSKCHSLVSNLNSRYKFSLEWKQQQNVYDISKQTRQANIANFFAKNFLKPRMHRIHKHNKSSVFNTLRAYFLVHKSFVGFKCEKLFVNKNYFSSKNAPDILCVHEHCAICFVHILPVAVFWAEKLINHCMWQQSQCKFLNLKAL